MFDICIRCFYYRQIGNQVGVCTMQDNIKVMFNNTCENYCYVRQHPDYLFEQKKCYSDGVVFDS